MKKSLALMTATFLIALVAAACGPAETDPSSSPRTFNPAEVHEVLMQTGPEAPSGEAAAKEWCNKNGGSWTNSPKGPNYTECTTTDGRFLRCDRTTWKCEFFRKVDGFPPGYKGVISIVTGEMMAISPEDYTKIVNDPKLSELYKGLLFDAPERHS